MLFAFTAMSFETTPRLQWVVERIAETFGLAKNIVTDFIRKRSNLQRFDDLFAGISSDQHLIVYHQSAEEDSSTDAPSELFLSSPMQHAIADDGRALYFLRNCPQEVAISQTVECDSTLLVQTVRADVWGDLEQSLSHMYGPIIKSRAAWGQAKSDEATKFVKNVSSFSGTLREAIDNLFSGITLEKPDLDMVEKATAKSRMNPDIQQKGLEYCKKMISNNWTKKIEKVLKQSIQTYAREHSKSQKYGNVPLLKSPLFELDYWRIRTQTLTSLVEQLQAPEIRKVFSAVATAIKTSSNTNRRGNSSSQHQILYQTLEDWKDLDGQLTEATIESKDNFKYLSTLKKFLLPLTKGSSPAEIMATLPALLNSIKMIYSISRYFSSSSQIESLFEKITNQIIENCKIFVDSRIQNMWIADSEVRTTLLESCISLNEAFHRCYEEVKEDSEAKAALGRGKQFAFDEKVLFMEFDFFCRRIIKIQDMFKVCQQFLPLKLNKREDMEGLSKTYVKIEDNIRKKNHDLLDTKVSAFDTDYLEFSVQISEMQDAMLIFIDETFSTITDVRRSLKLLKRFEWMKRINRLQSDLNAKISVVFQQYGVELDEVEKLYEKNKKEAVLARDLPPVAGHIAWSRQLLQRIEEPMETFRENEDLLKSKEAKKIIRKYNKMARALIGYEYLWYQAWVETTEAAKAGLQATLLVRHPEDSLLYVNFDEEIIQLTREAQCLERMGIQVPEAAKVVLLQKNKFKLHIDDLKYLLQNYENVKQEVLPVCSKLLAPLDYDILYTMRPGLVQLNWTSMHIDEYKKKLGNKLQQFTELIAHINDITDNRIEKNLLEISRAVLVDLPADQTFSLEEFVSLQKATVRRKAGALQGRNVQIESAVNDIIGLTAQYPLNRSIEPVDPEQIDKLKEHYNHFMYRALLNATKQSLYSLKKRLSTRNRSGNALIKVLTAASSVSQINQKPCFEVYVKLMAPSVILRPSLDDIQKAVSKAVVAVLGLSKEVTEWGRDGRMGGTFFDRVTKDIEIVRMCLLLTGGVMGTRNEVKKYLASFHKYAWLWEGDYVAAYKEFSAGNPSLEDYESELKRFADVENEINSLPTISPIGPLMLNTTDIKERLVSEAQQWKKNYSQKKHMEARENMQLLFDDMKSYMSKLSRPVTDLESLQYMMGVLKEIRVREATIADEEMAPVLDVYAMLQRYLPDGNLSDKEMDQKSVLQTKWKKLLEKAIEVMDTLRAASGGFKTKLLQSISEFKIDVKTFRHDFETQGPSVAGIEPVRAMERLKRFKDEYEFRDRKYKMCKIGEELFAMSETKYPALIKTKKELTLLTQLYDLYDNVLKTAKDWNDILWTDVVSNIEDMTQMVENFDSKCNKMPRKLREWDAYKTLRGQIDDFTSVLPLLEELGKESIEVRHWDEIKNITGTDFDQDAEDFKLETLLAANLPHYSDDVEEITEAADKQRSIRNKTWQVRDFWNFKVIEFQDWKDRGIPTMRAVPLLLEELEETQVELQTLLTMRHVTPYKEEVQEQLQRLSDTTDTLELWLKVQLAWGNLESVFLSGDIARQLPREAKKFSKIDKDWQKIMAKAQETAIATEATKNELLRTSLPLMYNDLESCQKSLEGYLEQKRNKFPRFYFCSNPVLLQILSQGSDPESMQQFYEKVFDAIQVVVHDKKDKSIIHTMKSRISRFEEIIPFTQPVYARGNVEEWLNTLLMEMRRTMKEWGRNCAEEVFEVSVGQSLRDFVDKQNGQFSLLGIQLMWTQDQTEAMEVCMRNKNAMRDMNKKAMDILQCMSKWTLDASLTKMDRKKIETLITIQVHQKDVTQELVNLYKAKQVKNPNNFDWLKQARFYWRPDGDPDIVDDEGCMTVDVTDVSFQYQWEYLGVKERLAITPLTDRCYISLAQALGMYFGGAPAGPAGTGKTETVKDMGRTLGIFVVVTNCTDQMSYKSCGKIFKGLCMSGLWGCFDEFNRIKLPVLSVVAQQVLAIQNAKKMALEMFSFPGDPQQIGLNPSCAFFITMNPGYAGRQELPENLKALFRSVAMMVPDFQIIIKVKISSVGYENYFNLSMKFHILYLLCKEQLSKQNHYDFGLRNILSVLRTAGKNLRDGKEMFEETRNPVDKDEYAILYRTLRDMNLSKLVAQDVPLFLSLMKDLFPSIEDPPDSTYPSVEAAIVKYTEKHKMVHYKRWAKKVVQLYETVLVRHGIQVIGDTGGGKTQMFRILMEALGDETNDNIKYKPQRLNPKAIRAQEMYGEVDPLSGEWTTGVFASIWSRSNSRANKFNTWIICDGPVDAIWIEDLNTVLDDNQILTLANGDRIPMTDNVKIMFENEQLDNASPATVSRCGIIYVSAVDLDWLTVTQAWLKSRPDDETEVLEPLFSHYIGNCTPEDTGEAFSYIIRKMNPVMKTSRIGQVTGLFNLLTGLLADAALNRDQDFEIKLERLFLYCFIWTVGGVLEPGCRAKMSSYLEERIADGRPEGLLPELQAGETYYEYYVDLFSLEWKKWKPDIWEYPKTGGDEQLDFSNLLVPTMDSTRAEFILGHMHKQAKPVLLIGGPGTAKTSTVLMYCNKFDPQTAGLKKVNFSFLTTMIMFQRSIEEILEKRGGRKFGPASGKKVTVFLDDLSMPEVNEWRDQPTLEIVRQVVEDSRMAFLDKDKRGDMKIIEDVQYLGGMGHPGGGKNDIPNRLKRHFLIFNMVLPSNSSIDDMYGQMLRGRFPAGSLDKEAMGVVKHLTDATIELAGKVKARMLPTPAKFHYVFNLRDISRVFQGILLTPMSTIKTGGIKVSTDDAAVTLVSLWKHECERVYCDKLTNHKDKNWYINAADAQCMQSFPQIAPKVQGVMPFVDFWREDEFDEDGILVGQAPKIYEPGGEWDDIKERVYHFLRQHNTAVKTGQMNLVMFTDALAHMVRISRIIGMPRGSALLVGVGGSGKQSLTRLAAYIGRQEIFQVTLTKSYNVSSLMEDIRGLYVLAGQQRKKTTFLFTDSEIKDERFLEMLNSMLMTGEIGGLFAKEEVLGMCADLQDAFQQQRPNLQPTPDNLRQFFIDTVRDNLHIVLCMSPANPKFAVRAQRFPGLINAVTIDWFLAWPEEALVAVSSTFLGDFQIECEADVKQSLMVHMGKVHQMTVDTCEVYFNQVRRRVSQTPKSYLSFIENFKGLYKAKYMELDDKAQRVSLGLEKLISGGEQVEVMKIALAKQKVKLNAAEKEAEKMLVGLQKSAAEAKEEGEKVAVIATACNADADRIAIEKKQCQADLDKAMPYVYEANDAIKSISKSDIQEISNLKNPPDLVKVVFDTVLLLFFKPLTKLEHGTSSIAKQEHLFIKPNWDESKRLMSDAAKLLAMLLEFGEVGKDQMNAETVEFLLPYIDFPYFNAEFAKKASNAAAGLCKFCRAMKFYYEASKIVKPKLEALAIAEGSLKVALAALAAAEAKKKECQDRLDSLQAMFEEKMAAKAAMEEEAKSLQRKMEKAGALITGLAGEKVRWGENVKTFGDVNNVVYR